MITATPTFNHWKGGVVTDFLWESEDSSMSLYDASSQESSFLFPEVEGKFFCAEEVVALAVVRGDAILADGITMFLGGVALVR